MPASDATKPVPSLWRFGPAGMLAVVVGTVLLLARWAGFDPFFVCLEWLVETLSPGGAMTIVTGLYAWFGLMWDFREVGAPLIEPNLWVASGFAIAMTIAGTPKRWLWMPMIIVVGGSFAALPFLWSGLVQLLRDSAGSSAELVLGAWVELGLVSQVVMVALATRDRRLAVPLAFVLVAALTSRLWLIDLAIKHISSDWGLPAMLWCWYAGFYAVLLHWSVTERRRIIAVAKGNICERCSYDLSATTGNLCPECGGTREPVPAAVSESPTPAA
jgi:hypothetical protein